MDGTKRAEIENLEFSNIKRTTYKLGYINDRQKLNNGTVRIIFLDSGDEYNGEFRWS